MHKNLHRSTKRILLKFYMFYVCIYICPCVYIKQVHKTLKHISALRGSISTLTAQASTKQLEYLLKLPVVVAGRLGAVTRAFPSGQDTEATLP